MAENFFKKIFANNWDELPLIFKHHYDFIDNKIYLSGKMTVKYNLFFKIISPLLNLFEILIAKEVKNAKTKVIFENKNEFVNVYRMIFVNHSIIRFYTRLYHVKNNEVIEMLKLNLGWNYSIEYADNQIKLIHKRYVIRIFNNYITIPLEFLIGKITSQENMINDKSFTMIMMINHDFWGELYRYSGEFYINE